MGYDVFISYSRRDGDFCTVLRNQLKQYGLSCWVDTEGIGGGTNWAATITDAIEQSKVLLLVMSEHSLKSPEVAKEVDLANAARKQFLPVRIQDVWPPKESNLKYHLAGTQFTDVFNKEFAEQFHSIAVATRRLLGLSDTNLDSSSNELQVLQNRFVNELNQRYKEDLSKAKTLFSLVFDSETITVVLPIQYGDMGAELKFELSNKRINAWVDLVSQSDTGLKEPLRDLFNECLSSSIPTMSYNSSAKRWGILKFFDIDLKYPFVELNHTRNHDLYKEIVIGFLDKAMPPLSAWLETEKVLNDLYVNLEVRLKDIFSPEEGWSIENTLMQYRSCSQISIYHNTWLFDDKWADFASIEILPRKYIFSLTIEATNPLSTNFWFGINGTSNYWQIHYGDFERQIKEACDQIFGTGEGPNKWWSWAKAVDDPFRNSGVNSRTLVWNSEETKERLIDYYSGILTKLKEISPLIEQACRELPSLQDKNPIETTDGKSWNMGLLQNLSHVFVRDTLNKSNELVKAQEGLFKYRVNEGEVIIYTTRKMGDLSIVLIGRLWPKGLTIGFDWWGGPPTVKSIVADYFKKYHATPLVWSNSPYYNYLKIAETISDKEFGGGTIQEWFEEFNKMTLTHIPKTLSTLERLIEHASKIKDLSNSICNSLRDIFSVDEGWVIKNDIEESLDQYTGISIWKKEWCRETGARPVLSLRLESNIEMFDDLFFGIQKQSETLIVPDIHNKVLSSLFEYEFNSAESSEWWVAWKLLDEQYRYTGGRRFDIEFLEGEKQDDFLGYIVEVFKKCKKFAPYIGQAVSEILQPKRDL